MDERLTDSIRNSAEDTSIRSGWQSGLFLFCGGVLVLLILLMLFHLAAESTKETVSSAPPRAQVTDQPAEPDENEQLCRRFMELVNAQDPGAVKLLGPQPTIPADPVTPEEADRLDTEIALHQRPLHIKDVHREKGTEPEARRFVLVAEGSVSSERFRVQTPTGSEFRQRVLWSPDLIVEVRDGVLHGVAARLHED